MRSAYGLVLLVGAILILTGIESKAQTHLLASGQTYIGDEQVNEEYTGNKCYVTISSVAALSTKGLHCHSIGVQFQNSSTELPKKELVLNSPITNYHRSEYPQVKSCAMNINGTTSGNEIYGRDTSAIYNQFFSGQLTLDSTQFDYFVTMSASTKKAVRTRIHVMNWYSEKDVDCVNLKEL